MLAAERRYALHIKNDDHLADTDDATVIVKKENVCTTTPLNFRNFILCATGCLDAEKSALLADLSAASDEVHTDPLN